MEPEAVAALITILTPAITGAIKAIIPAWLITGFKRFVPVIPPLVGAVLGYAGQRYGLSIIPEINSAVTGLFLGAMGSSGYDAVKAQKK